MRNFGSYPPATDDSPGELHHPFEWAQTMTPEEIVSVVTIQNHFILADTGVTNFTREKVSELMNVAAMQGFRDGSESALSLVKGNLYLKQLRESTAGAV